MHMSNMNKEIQQLANMNEDACEFYATAQDKVENERLKSSFKSLQTLHKNVVVNLQDYIRTNGGQPETNETFIGEAREFWGNMMASISNDTDTTLVKHLEETEDRCLHKIEDMMQNDDIPSQTKSALIREHETLRKSHDYMKSLKKAMTAA